MFPFRRSWNVYCSQLNQQPSDFVIEYQFTKSKKIESARWKMGFTSITANEHIALSLFIKQTWKLAYLCLICIQMLKHKLQMTFHFMWFLSCHSSLSVKQFHTGKFILKLDQNVHILIFFEIFSAKKSRMNSLYWNVNRKRCSGFSFCLLSKTIFNLKFFMRLVARFMDRTQDCNITNTRLQLEWRKLHRLPIYAFPMRIFENSSKKTIPKSTTMEHIFERCLHTDLNFKCFSILLEIVQISDNVKANLFRQIVCQR